MPLERLIFFLYFLSDGACIGFETLLNNPFGQCTAIIPFFPSNYIWSIYSWVICFWDIVSATPSTISGEFFISFATEDDLKFQSLIEEITDKLLSIKMKASRKEFPILALINIFVALYRLKGHSDYGNFSRQRFSISSYKFTSQTTVSLLDFGIHILNTHMFLEISFLQIHEISRSLFRPCIIVSVLRRVNFIANWVFIPSLICIRK